MRNGDRNNETCQYQECQERQLQRKADQRQKASAHPKVQQTKLLIDGKWVTAASGKTFETINPATEEVIAQVAEGDAADVDLAVKAARKAFENGPWRKMDARDRGRLMNKLADLIEKNTDELAALETLDNGKPIRERRNADLPLVIDCFRYYAGWADKIHGKTIPVRGNYFCYTRREPVGVVGQIIPWNFPMLMAAWKWGPALAAGCTVVMKPAEQTPLTCLRMAELAQEAGFPDGVINIVPGYGPTAGAALVTPHGRRQDRLHRRSTEVGQIIMRDAAEHAQARHARAGRQEPQHRLRRRRSRRGRRRLALRPVLQPGPMLLRRQPAVRRGEGPRQVRREAASAMNKSRKLGDPFDPDDRARPAGRPGPVRQDHGLHRRRARRKGAKCLTGGERVGDRGYFIKPTIFADVKDDMTIAQDEIFGPVMSGAQVQGRRRGRSSAPTTRSTAWPPPSGPATSARPTASPTQLRAGTVWVNCYDVFDAAAPFGGFKMSRHRPRAGRIRPGELHRGEDRHGSDLEAGLCKPIGTTSRGLPASGSPICWPANRAFETLS